MKLLLLTAAIAISTHLFAQHESTPQQIKEVGWTLELPADFEIADSATVAMGTLKGKDAEEKNMVKKYGLDKVRNLIAAAKGKYNYFNANLNISKIISSKNWEAADQSAKQVYFNSFSKQIPFIKIDTSTTVQKIGGVEFNKFQAVCYINSNNIFTAVHFGAFYKEQYFSIYYYFMEYSAGNELEKMLDDSKFDK